MKKILLIFGACAILGLRANAQIQLTYAENALRTGDTHITQLADFTSVGASGSNVVWDFSQLVLRGSHTSSTMKAEDTPFAKAFPEANTAIVENGNYFYYNVQPNLSEQWGWTTNNVIVRYDPPLRKYTFPFSFQDSISGKFSGGTSFSLLNGEYSSKIDGFGTLKLPNNVVLKNVIRLKATENFTEVSCNSIEVSMTKYFYYTNKYRYPLLMVMVRHEQMSDGTVHDKKYLVYNDNLDSELSIRNSNNITGVATIADAEIEYKVYPNPVVSDGAISYTLPDKRFVQIEIINSEGKTIAVLANEDEDAGLHSQTFNSSQMSARDAAYYIKMMFGNKVYLEKIIFQRN